MKKLTILIFSLFVALEIFAGGGWVNKKQEGFFMLSERVIVADKYYTNSGELFTNDFPTTGVYITNLYGEYGLGKRFEALVDLPILYRITKNEIRYSSGNVIPGDELTSVGDAQLGIKYGLSEKLPIAISYRLGLPFGNPAGGESGILQTGNGAWENMLRIDGSASYSKKGYVSLYGAFNKRSEGYSDETYLGFETGYQIGKLWLIFKVDALNSLQNGTVAVNGSGNTQQLGLFSNNIEYLSWSFEGLFEVTPKWGVDLMTSSVFNAKNILAAPAYRLGVFYKLKKSNKPSSIDE